MRAREGRGSEHTASQRPCARRAGSRRGLAITAQRMQGRRGSTAQMRIWPGSEGSGGTRLVSDCVQGNSKAGKPSPGFGNAAPVTRQLPAPVQAQPSSGLLLYSLLFTPTCTFLFLFSFIPSGAGFAADFFHPEIEGGLPSSLPNSPLGRGALWHGLSAAWTHCTSFGGGLLLAKQQVRGQPAESRGARISWSHNAGGEKAQMLGKLFRVPGTRGGRGSAVSGP